jgi:hypothetical protein
VPVPDEVARVPIARLWDTDQYTGANPDVTTSAAIGLAKYSQANFFSAGSIASPAFPFPAEGSLAGFTALDPKTGLPRRYCAKVRDGELITHAATVSGLLLFPPSCTRLGLGLDDTVFRAYAEKLLPRAIGYSIALLDYFVRGQVSADPVPAPSGAQLAFDLRNETANETFEGTVRILYDNAAGQRVEVPGLSPPTTLTLLATGAPVRVTFTRPTDNPSGEYLIVLVGALGEERPNPEAGFPGAVLARRTPRTARQTTPSASFSRLVAGPPGSPIAGDLILVWQQVDSGGRRLLYSRSAPDGTDRVSPVAVFPYGTSFLDPPVGFAVGPDGDTHLAFRQVFITGAALFQ